MLPGQASLLLRMSKELPELWTDSVLFGCPQVSNLFRLPKQNCTGLPGSLLLDSAGNLNIMTVITVITVTCLPTSSISAMKVEIPRQTLCVTSVTSLIVVLCCTLIALATSTLSPASQLHVRCPYAAPATFHAGTTSTGTAWYSYP